MMQVAWRNMARFLEPSGKFVGIVRGSIGLQVDNEVVYGFSYKRLKAVEDGWLVNKTIHAEQGPVSFKAFLLKDDICRELAEAAGMRDVRIDKPEIMPE